MWAVCHIACSSVRFIRIGSPGSFIVSIELVMLKKNVGLHSWYLALL